MSVPINPETCQTESSYCKFGSETILKLIDVFESQLDGVIDNKDPEYVHKTRVASRRLRAALPVFRFCFPRKNYKKWKNEIRNITRLLAESRDLDVQIAFIQHYLEKLGSSSEKSCLDILLQNHKRRRSNIQPNLVIGIQKLKSSFTLEEILTFCHQSILAQATETFDKTIILEKARWNIAFGSQNFLGMEEYVLKENEKQKHHQMRIYAKKLRYTMEIFASMYTSKLTKEIGTTKEFQDILGEMHDCDVWINYIPKFIEETKNNPTINSGTATIADVEQTLLNFQTFIKDERKKHYTQFVHLWEENKKKNFFSRLKATTNTELIQAEEKNMKTIIQKNDVKIAVLSDIHANITALERVIRDAEERGASLFINAGDSVGFGPCPNETIKLICEKNILSILGNYDVEVIEGKIKDKGPKNLAFQFAKKELSRSSKNYLNNLPRERRIEVVGRKILITHGSPESIDEHIYSNTPVERLKHLAETAKTDIIILGHTHEQFWTQVNGISFVNPGSVGRPNDGNPQTAYALISFNPFNVELIRLDYDVVASADALRKKHLPQNFAQMLFQGLSLDAINQEDEKKKDTLVQNYKETVESCRNFALKYWKDSKHSSKVTQLSLQFFDYLASVHKLSKRERCWLECASILHDIGLSKGRGGHNKATAKLILNDTQLPFSSQERQIIASIAQYHRKGLPKRNHYNLSALNRVTINQIKVLASFLRVADGLDYTHHSFVKRIKIREDTNWVIVEYESKNKSILEEQAFNKKKDLFEKVFAKTLVLIWKQPL
jgi:putative phosphoesterase